MVLAEKSNIFQLIESCPDKPMTDEECDDLRKFLTRLKEHADKLNLQVSSAVLKDKIIDLPQNRREFDLLTDVIKKEIKSRIFLFIPTHRSPYYEWDLPSKLIDSFPTASK